MSAKDVIEHDWFLKQKDVQIDKEIIQSRLNNLMNFRAE